MGFKIISCGWNCEQFIEQTLRSVEKQVVGDWEMLITYEGTEDHGDELIRQWISDHGNDPRWNYVHNAVQLGSDTRTRQESIQRSNPDDHDIILFLDLDGDELSNPYVLEKLRQYYSDDTLVTYGSYLPKPPDDGCVQATHYPDYVVTGRAYRAYGRVLFNHLRTMKGLIWKAIPEHEFKWRRGPKAGQWYEKGCDVQFTFCALELAGSRFKVISEILMYYNSINPMSAWRVCPDDCSATNLDFIACAPLPMLEEITSYVDNGNGSWRSDWGTSSAPASVPRVRLPRTGY